MTRLKQYELVRVRLLLKKPEEYDDWNVNQRAPAIGDVGTLLDTLFAPGAPNSYVVESSGQDGITIWLSGFLEEEIESVSP